MRAAIVHVCSTDDLAAKVVNAGPRPYQPPPLSVRWRDTSAVPDPVAR